MTRMQHIRTRTGNLMGINGFYKINLPISHMLWTAAVQAVASSGKLHSGHDNDFGDLILIEVHYLEL